MSSFDPHPAPSGASHPAVAPHGAELPPVVASFLERLKRVPLGAWAEAGRRLEALDGGAADASGDASVSGEAIRSQLRQVVNAMPHVAAHTRHRVLDLATMAQGFMHPAEVARMKKAALAAALALVARPTLGEERFARIYEPFEALIPVASLGPNARANGGAPRWSTPFSPPPLERGV